MTSHIDWPRDGFRLPERHELSPASKAADEASQRYYTSSRLGVALFGARASEAELAVNRQATEAARLEWRRLVALAGDGP